MTCELNVVVDLEDEVGSVGEAERKLERADCTIQHHFATFRAIESLHVFASNRTDGRQRTGGIEEPESRRRKGCAGKRECGVRWAHNPYVPAASASFSSASCLRASCIAFLPFASALHWCTGGAAGAAAGGARSAAATGAFTRHGPPRVSRSN